MRTRDLKARMEEVEEGYQDARDEAFYEEFEDVFVVNGALVPITEDEVQGFIDSFTFESEADWCYSKVQSEIDTYNDCKYEEWKDER